MDRKLNVEWTDPALAMQAGRGLTGLEIMQAIGAGRIAPPPAAQVLGVTLLRVANGHIEMGLEPAEWMYNTIGSLHGGMVTTLMDSAMGSAVTSTLDADTMHATLDLHVNFVRPASVRTGPLRAIGRVLHRGSRTSTAEGQLVDAAGNLYAHATTTCLLMQRGERR